MTMRWTMNSPRWCLCFGWIIAVATTAHVLDLSTSENPSIFNDTAEDTTNSTSETSIPEWEITTEAITSTIETTSDLSVTSPTLREQRWFWTSTTAKSQRKIQCGKSLARRGRIVGGKDTYAGEFPWTVSVRLLTTHFCGGVIIHKSWILTAAHCVKRYSARYFRVRMGEVNVNVEESRPDIDVLVEQINVHPEFGNPRRFSNDVAVLKLKWPLDFTPLALPICLPSGEDPISKDSLVGRNAIVVGWGWLNELDKGKNKAKRLQKVQVPVLNNTLCEKWYSDEYKGYVQIHDYQICAGYKEGGRDSCQGDSGGPLIMKDGDHYTLIGVVSAGVGCARKHMPGIYSRVSSFIPWIKNVTGIP